MSSKWQVGVFHHPSPKNINFDNLPWMSASLWKPVTQLGEVPDINGITTINYPRLCALKNKKNGFPLLLSFLPKGSTVQVPRGACSAHNVSLWGSGSMWVSSSALLTVLDAAKRSISFSLYSEYWSMLYHWVSLQRVAGDSNRCSWSIQKGQRP